MGVRGPETGLAGRPSGADGGGGLGVQRLGWLVGGLGARQPKRAGIQFG